MGDNITKRLILTIDYEVFLGSKTGDLQDVLIEPTYKLMKILKLNGSKMTVFWDVLHYYAICKWIQFYPYLSKEKELIEQQILDLVNEGHDVQMHIHPHWLDAKYVEGKWIFDYSHFSIHKLSSIDDKCDENTIIGCLSLAKNLMESVIRQTKPDYVVRAYRAGGYLIEPFSLLRDAFLKLEIGIDSSVCPDMSNECIPFPLDFRDYPSKVAYRFSNTPRFVDEMGPFVEYPITIFKLSPFFRVKRWIHSKLSKKSGAFLGGKGVVFPHNKLTTWHKIRQIFGKTTVQLTTDGGDEYIYDYTISNAPDDSVMILHPKMQTDQAFSYLEQLLKDNYVLFTTI